MVFEQMLTILFGTGVGVAIVLYAARPRQVAPSISSSMSSSISSMEMIATDTVPAAATMPEVTATESRVVEAQAEIHTSSAAVPTTVADVVTAAAASTEAAPVASIDAAAVAAPTVSSVVEAPTQGVRAHRAQRRRSAASRTQARPSSRTTRKR